MSNNLSTALHRWRFAEDSAKAATENAISRRTEFAEALDAAPEGLHHFRARADRGDGAPARFGDRGGRVVTQPSLFPDPSGGWCFVCGETRTQPRPDGCGRECLREDQQ